LQSTLLAMTICFHQEMLPRLLQVGAGGPTARSAPVATILPGDAAAVLAAVCI
jgi:hypothetical protein